MFYDYVTLYCGTVLYEGEDEGEDGRGPGLRDSGTPPFCTGGRGVLCMIILTVVRAYVRARDENSVHAVRETRKQNVRTAEHTERNFSSSSARVNLNNKLNSKLIVECRVVVRK